MIYDKSSLHHMSITYMQEEQPVLKTRCTAHQKQDLRSGAWLTNQSGNGKIQLKWGSLLKIEIKWEVISVSAVILCSSGGCRKYSELKRLEQQKRAEVPLLWQDFNKLKRNVYVYAHFGEDESICASWLNGTICWFLADSWFCVCHLKVFSSSSIAIYHLL